MKKSTTSTTSRLRHWTISHAPFGETVRCDDITLNDLVRELDKAMPPAAWRNLDGLFDRRADDQFTVNWPQAEQISYALSLASCSPDLSPSAVELAERLAAAAAGAATARELWRWSSHSS